MQEPDLISRIKSYLDDLAETCELEGHMTCVQDHRRSDGKLVGFTVGLLKCDDELLKQAGVRIVKGEGS